MVDIKTITAIVASIVAVIGLSLTLWDINIKLGEKVAKNYDNNRYEI